MRSAWQMGPDRRMPTATSLTSLDPHRHSPRAVLVVASCSALDAMGAGLLGRALPGRWRTACLFRLVNARSGRLRSWHRERTATQVPAGR